MRKWMYFITADATHLQTRLERLAKKGLELTSTEGLFTGVFQETQRPDLAYLVLPYGADRHAPSGESGERYGWQLMGGFNGMAIWKSMPCSQPDADGLREQIKGKGSLRPDRLTVPILLSALLLFTVALWIYRDALTQEPWYLSYQSMGVGLLKAVTLGLTAANLVTLRSYASAWVHGVTPWCLMGSALALLLLTVLDQREQQTFFLLLLLIVALACGLSFWQRNRALALSTSGLCLVVLCLGLLFPNARETDTNSMQLHNSLAGQPVVQLTDLGETGTLYDTEYQTDGTLLVRRITYYEWGEEETVTSTTYRCLTEDLADQLLQRQLEQGSWTETEGGWQSEDGKCALLRAGRLVICVTYSQPITQAQLDAIAQKLA